MIDGSHPLESAFSQIEGESNLAIKELISCENVGELYQENFINLCKFVGLQYVRTEEKRIQIEETGNFALRELFVADHPEFDKDLVERLSVTNELLLRVHLNAIKEYTKIAAVTHNMKNLVDSALFDKIIL